MILIFILSPIHYDFHKEILIDFVKGAIITLVNKVMVSLVSLLTFNVIPLSLTLVGTLQLRHPNRKRERQQRMFSEKKTSKKLAAITLKQLSSFSLLSDSNFYDCPKYFFRSIVRPLFPG